MSSSPISSKLVDEPMPIHCTFILSGINSCLNQNVRFAGWCTCGLFDPQRLRAGGEEGVNGASKGVN